MRLILNKAVLIGVLAVGVVCVPIVAFAAEHTSSRATTPASRVDRLITQAASEAVWGEKPADGVLAGQSLKPTAPKSNRSLSGRDIKHVSQQLYGMRLRVCDLRAKRVNSLMALVVRWTTGQTEFFTTVAARVETFYVRSGETLAGYDQLVTAVNVAQAKAAADVQALNSLGAFRCSGNDPRGQVSSFQVAAQTEIKDLKAFRLSVKNLIVAVKSVVGAAQAEPGVKQ